MGMYGILITCSAKRLAQIEGDPETLEDGLRDEGRINDEVLRRRPVLLAERDRACALRVRAGRPPPPRHRLAAGPSSSRETARSATLGSGRALSGCGMSGCGVFCQHIYLDDAPICPMR